MSRIAFAKGHGTGNDFILVLDPTNEIVLNRDQVAKLCDRHVGLGADGILHAIQESNWFMDYRNADGSTAEMCGNGIRVFAEFLYRQNLIGDVAEIDTRAGAKRVERAGDNLWNVDMGVVGLESQLVDVPFGHSTYHATSVDVGNPHLVIRLDSLKSLPKVLSWNDVGTVDTRPGGFNIEFFEVQSRDIISMRVLERGVGETLSCGTGVCAAAFVHLNSTGGVNCEVEVPGGTLHVTKVGDAVQLMGPVELIADGYVEY